jgi:formamidopyrimidine-DNA glycosylase
MPELPDVAGFRRYLNATSLHQKIVRTSVPDERILQGVSSATLVRRLKNAKFESTTRHGKFLFAAVDRGGWLVQHFGMTGEPKYERADDDPPRFARVLFEFDNDYRLAYTNRRMLGEVGFTEDLEQFIAKRDLGPDALDGELTVEAFIDAFRDRRGFLKSTLMEQSIIAGIGNVYADEILFRLGLHPSVKLKQLDERALRKVYRVMRQVLQSAEKKGGAADRLPKSFLLPHREGDHRCPACGGELETAAVAGRTSHFCSSCQSLP